MVITILIPLWTITLFMNTTTMALPLSAGYAGERQNLSGNTQIIVIIIVASGMLVTAAMRSGATLTMFVDGNIIKDGVTR